MNNTKELIKKADARVKEISNAMKAVELISEAFGGCDEKDDITSFTDEQRSNIQISLRGIPGHSEIPEILSRILSTERYEFIIDVILNTIKEEVEERVEKLNSLLATQSDVIEKNTNNNDNVATTKEKKLKKTVKNELKSKENQELTKREFTEGDVKYITENYTKGTKNLKTVAEHLNCSSKELYDFISRNGLIRQEYERVIY